MTKKYYTHQGIKVDPRNRAVKEHLIAAVKVARIPKEALESVQDDAKVILNGFAYFGDRAMKVARARAKARINDKITPYGVTCEEVLDYFFIVEK